jgi:hypothetical protein
MSWYGIHAPLRQGTARSLLVPGTCKWCIYLFRTSLIHDAFKLDTVCSRCGLHRSQLRKARAKGLALVEFERQYK